MLFALWDREERPDRGAMRARAERARPTCWRAWEAGDEAGAEAAYAAFLPAATFGMRSLGHLACHGRRVWGLRAGGTIHGRAPAMRPTEAGPRLARGWASRP